MQTIALVTGANRGIGHEVVRQLADLGFTTLLSGRAPDAVQQAAQELSREGQRIEALALDVADEGQIESAAEIIERQFGRLDILIHNAGEYLDDGKSVFDLPLETLQATLASNLIGPLKLTQHLLPLLKRSTAGRIVNVSSGMGALHEMSGRDAAYRISKTALNALTRIMASELKSTVIKVNAVCPGWVRTDMGGQGAPRSVEEGARGIVWAATLPENGPTGGFFRDGERIEW